MQILTKCYWWLIKYFIYSISAANSLSPNPSFLIMRLNIAARLIPNSISITGGSLETGSVISAWQLHKRITARVIINLFILSSITHM